jgi:hypothetical protein
MQLLLYQWIGWLGFVWLITACAEVFDVPDAVHAPRITSIAPDSGAVNTAVVINGTNFSPVIRDNVVKFNDKEATVTVATATKLIALVPAHAGTGNIEVVVRNKATEGPIFTFFETPLITKISPTEGKPCTVVTIQGKYFDTTAVNNIVRFGGKIAAINPPSKDTLLTAVVPADAITGEVTVTVNGITGVGPLFKVLGTSDSPIHTVTAISPTRGSAGTVVTIAGQNFNLTAANNIVKFNGVAAQVTAATGTQITALAPEGGSTGLVSVTIGNATVNGPTFTYEPASPAPTITNLDPNSGTAGTLVAIVGTNFSADLAGNLVQFNGKTAVVISATTTLLKATVPEAASTGPVTVTVGDKISNGYNFTYIDNAPTIIDFTPKTGPVGTIVRITGTNFGNNTTAINVKFNGINTPVQEGNGGTSVTVAVPQEATTGRITLTVNNQTTTSAQDFVVTVQTVASWAPTGSMNVARDGHTATLLRNGKVLVVGGTNRSGITYETLGSCELYDPATGQWTYTGSLNVDNVRAHHTATLLADGRVLVAGGYQQERGSNSLASCAIYDPATGQWTYTGFMNEPRFFHKAILLPNGKVLATGGLGLVSWGAISCELFDPTTGQWTMAAPMSIGRYNHTATLLQDNRVLVTSGVVTRGGTTTAEVYNYQTGQWSGAGNLSVARENHIATLLPDGKVLISGSAPATQYYELFNPTTQSWSPGPTTKLPFPVSAAAVVLLPDQRVLVFGRHLYR